MPHHPLRAMLYVEYVAPSPVPGCISLPARNMTLPPCMVRSPVTKKLPLAVELTPSLVILESPSVVAVAKRGILPAVPEMPPPPEGQLEIQLPAPVLRQMVALWAGLSMWSVPAGARVLRPRLIGPHD